MALANGLHEEGSPLSNLFDGNKDTFYLAKKAEGSLKALVSGGYVDVDFAGLVQIDEIILTLRSDVDLNCLDCLERY